MRAILIYTCFLFAYSQVCSQREPVENLITAMSKCYEEMEVDKSILIFSTDNSRKLAEGNDVLNDFFACTFRKADLLLDDGNLDIQLLKKVVENSFDTPQNIVDRGILACKDVKGNSEGDTVVKVYNCLVEQGALP